MKTFSEAGIETNGRTGQFKMLCNRCSETRTKNRDEECLSVNTETGLWQCFHCSWSGALEGFERTPQPKYHQRDFVIPEYNEQDWELTEFALDYFDKRGISETTLRLNYVGSRFGKMGMNECNIASFPYFKGEHLVNVGYRNLDAKTFRLYPKAEVCFYGMQNLFTAGNLNTKKLVLVEGQIDLLSFYEAGITYAISVPQGSPFEEGKTSNPKLEFLDDPFFLSIIGEIDEIIIATDMDYAGRAMANELSERLGVERCSRVTFPEKDANEVLVNLGKEALLECLLERKPMIQGLVSVSDLSDKLSNYYSEGFHAGMITGIDKLDDIFTLETGFTYLFHGAPESYKTVLVDNICVRYAQNYGVHTALYSPETPDILQVSRLVSIHTGESIGSPKDKNRILYPDFIKASKWVDKHFTFIQPLNPTLDEILSLAKVSVIKNNTKILVLDSFSKIDWDGENLHHFVRKMMSKLNEFAKRYNVAVILVAHPKKMESIAKKGEEMQDYKIPQPYDVAESSHFYNASDFIVGLWRSRLIEDAPLKFIVQKSKFWHIARSGYSCQLYYNFDTWTFN